MNFSVPSAAGVWLHTRSFSLLPAVLVAGALLFAGASPVRAAIELNGIAAKVNGKVVTKKEVAFHLAPMVAVLQAKYPRRGAAYEKELREIRNSVLDRLIENEIVLTELERRGAQIPSYVIDSEVKRIIGEVFNGNETEFRKSLKESGMNMQGFRESQEEKIMIQAFRAQQFNDVPPATSSEISAHFAKRRSELRDRSQDKVTYRKIFLRAIDPNTPGSTPESQLELAEKITHLLRTDNADFAEMAKEHSDGAYAADGGLWEDEERVNLSPAFAEVIFESEPGAIVGPLKDPAGFIIIKVIEKKLGPSPPLSEVRDRMRQEVEIEKRSARYKKWMDVIKRSAMIERRI